MTPRAALAVHAYYPRIGGSEAHVRWIAGGLRNRGFLPFVVTPRRPAEPRSMDGLEITPDPASVLTSDVVFTYSVSDLTLEVAAQLCASKDCRPRWLHHPCAVGSHGLAMLKEADRIVAFNDRDVALTQLACGSSRKVLRIFPGAHEERRGCPGRFRSQVRHPYILWVGAWSRAKGARCLSERFAAFRDRHKSVPLRLVMFGASGGDDWPIRHPDILTIDRNWEDVPDAMADCLFLAFNSPPHPVGYDANPIVLLEAILNAKTFVAQAGTPFLSEVGDLGLIAQHDDDWLEAVEALVFDSAQRRRLEAACCRASATRYNFARMMDGFESGLRELLDPGTARGTTR